MKIAEYLAQASEFTVVVDETEQGWMRATFTAPDQEPVAFTVHGNVVVEEEATTKP